MKPYRDFVFANLNNQAVMRGSFDFFQAAVDAVWETAIRDVPWNDMEQLARDILGSVYIDDTQRVRLLKEAIPAYTRRGSVDPRW
jgi:hypothetical protein